MNRPIDKVYSYDIDGNLFHLDTHILLEELQDDGSWKLIEVPVKEFDHNILYNYTFHTLLLRNIYNNLKPIFVP